MFIHQFSAINWKTDYKQKINFIDWATKQKKNVLGSFSISPRLPCEKKSYKWKVYFYSTQLHAQYPRHFLQWINVVWCFCYALTWTYASPHRYFVRSKAIEFHLQLLLFHGEKLNCTAQVKDCKREFYDAMNASIFVKLVFNFISLKSYK